MWRPNENRQFSYWQVSSFLSQVANAENLSKLLRSWIFYYSFPPPSLYRGFPPLGVTASQRRPQCAISWEIQSFNWNGYSFLQRLTSGCLLSLVHTLFLSYVRPLTGLLPQISIGRLTFLQTFRLENPYLKAIIPLDLVKFFRDS